MSLSASKPSSPRKKIVVLGSTGSIGENVLRVVEKFPDRFQIIGLAAQRQAELTLALRRPNDDSAINRMDAGMVDRSTFEKLLEGLQAVQVPQIPGQKEKAK